MYISAICLLSVVLFYKYLGKKYDYWKLRNVPYEKPYLIFGNLYDVLSRKQHLFEKVKSIYDNFPTLYVGMFLFYKPAILIRSPRLFKTILVQDFNSFINRGIAEDLTADPLAFYTLFFMRGNSWRELRSKLSSAFTPCRIKSMYAVMQHHADKVVLFLDEHKNETLELKMLMRRFSTDVAAACALGVNTDCLTNQKSEFFAMAERLIDTSGFVRMISMFSYYFMHKLVSIFKLTFADKGVTDYLGKVFQKSINRKRKMQRSERQDFVDSMLDLSKNGSLLSSNKHDEETAMVSQILTFFGAGADTIGIVLAFTLYELAKDDTIQTRLRNCVKDALVDKKVTYETLQSVKYLEMVVNETLRKYPLAGILLRSVERDYVIEETGLTLEKDTAVLIPISGLHYDPAYYPDPSKFDPERFSEDNYRKIPQFAYMPFGDGPRYCIGKNFALVVIKMAVANIIKDFEFKTTAETKEDVDFDPYSTQFIQNNGGIYLKVQRVL